MRSDHSAFEQDSVDQFLAECVRQIWKSKEAPLWPRDWHSNSDDPLSLQELVAERIRFHGIALVLCGFIAGWPEQLASIIKQEARNQTFWEQSHRQAIACLIEAFDEAGIETVVIKGTALAYSRYDVPAMRRRGDTDLLVVGGDHETSRKILAAQGFRQTGDILPLQESWMVGGSMGFDHIVDVHWRVHASAAVSESLEQAHILSQRAALSRLAPHAQRLGLAQNLVLTCLNRAFHTKYGYLFEARKCFQGDRLIWAIDIDLGCCSFAEGDWQELHRMALASGTQAIVRSGLEFAQSALGTPVPDTFLRQLAHDPGAAVINRYLRSQNTLERLRLDLSASRGSLEKFRILKSALLPGNEVLAERFPNAANWPVPVLRLRRLLAAMGRTLRGSN